MRDRPVDFQGALSWLNRHLGHGVALSVAAGPDRRSNWALQTQGVLGPGPGMRQLVDHLGGVVVDYVVGDHTRIQLVEDDLVGAAVAEDDDSLWLSLDLGDAQMHFGIAG